MSSNDRPTVTEVPPQAARRIPAALPTVDPANYEILGEHGRGGLGRILAARDKRTGRQVAIKEMLPGVPYGMGLRFAREARITANLQHPAIVPVYEVGRWPSGEPFYAMKLVLGRSLSAVLDEAKTLKDRLALLPAMQTVADAIAYAHEQRIVHRDLKPSNVLLGKFGETVVIDWGLAKWLGEADPEPDSEPAPTQQEPAVDAVAPLGADRELLTAIGAVMGTPAYMPPEQANGEAVDESSDIYALGVMLYEMLTGDTPHDESGTPAELLSRIVAGEARPVRQLAPEIPADLVTIVEKASAYRRVDRYASAAELAEDLRRFQTGQLVSAHHYSMWTLVRRWAWRHRAVVGVSVIALIILAIGGAIGVTRVVRERDRAQRAEGVAVDNANRAAQRLADLHEEEGRQLLVAGNRQHALVHFEAALRTGPSPRLRFQIARALEAFAPLAVEIDEHESTIFDTEWAPNGKRIATVSGEDVRIWDTTTGTKIATITHGIKQPMVAWSRDDSRLLVYGGPDAFVVDATTGARVGPALAMTAHSSITAAAWGRDVLVLADIDGHVAVRDAATFEVRHETLIEDAAQPEAITIRADGTLVIDSATSVIIRDANLHVVTLAAPGSPVTGSPDGRFLLAEGDPPALVKVSDGKLVAMLEGADGLHAAQFTNDGAWVVVTGGEASTVRIFSTSDGAPGARLVGHKGKVTCTAWRPDGAMIATGGEDRTVRLWDARTGAPLAVFQQESPLKGLIFSADGSLVAATDEDFSVTLWDARAHGGTVGLGGSRSRATGTLDAGGTTALLTDSDGSVTIYDAQSGAVVHALASAGARRTARRGANGRIAIAGEDGLRVVGADGTPLATIPGKFTEAALSADGAQVAAVADPPTSVSVWNADSGAAIVRFDVAPAPRIAWSPDGTRVALGGGSDVDVWDLAPRAHRAHVTFDGEVMALTFSPDGSRLATVAGATVVIVDIADESKRLVIPSDLSAFALAWSPDGARIATGGIDPNVHVWDARTGAPLARLPGHDEGVAALAWTEDGEVLAAGGLDGVIRFWDPHGGRLLSTYTANGRVVDLSTHGGRMLVGDLDAPSTVIDVSDYMGDAAGVDLAVRCWSHAKLADEAVVPAEQDPAACAQLRNVSSDRP